MPSATHPAVRDEFMVLGGVLPPPLGHEVLEFALILQLLVLFHELFPADGGLAQVLRPLALAQLPLRLLSVAPAPVLLLPDFALDVRDLATHTLLPACLARLALRLPRLGGLLRHH